MRSIILILMAALLVAGCNKKIIIVEKPTKESRYKFVKIHFPANSAELAGGGLLEVLQNINTLRASGFTDYAVIGHACNEVESDGQKLAQKRAEAVKKALWNFGIDTEKAALYVGAPTTGIDCGYVEIVEK